MQRLKWVPQGALSWCFASIHLVDIETCSECGGDVRIIASIALGRLGGEDPSTSATIRDELAEVLT
jgi:hypothetical protein